MNTTELRESVAPIPVCSPRQASLAQRREILAAIERTLDRGMYILGEEVTQFESEFAAYLGSQSAIGVASGTDALHVALWAGGIGKDDSVLTVSNTAVATVAAIHLCGARPVLVDIDPASFSIDVNRMEETLKRASGKRIRAVIPVHLYGHPAPMREIDELAKKYDLLVIEDCAQAHGAEYEGKKVGTFGRLGSFSFYPTKNLGALGDGGAVVTSDSDLAKQARMLRQYGWERRYISDFPGMNSRLDELQAAILRIKLRSLEEGNSRRREIAKAYNQVLNGVDVLTPREIGNVKHAYHQYVIRTKNRDSLREYLLQESIETAVLYPVPIHMQEAYSGYLEIGAGGLAATEAVAKEIVSLPIFPELAPEQVSRVAGAVAAWATRHCSGKA